MDRADMELELAVWREVGRHLEIEVCLQRLFPIIAQAMQVDAMWIRKLDREKGRAQTLAVAGATGARIVDGSYRTLVDSERVVWRGHLSAHDPLGVTADSYRRDAMAGLLSHQDDETNAVDGVVILAGTRDFSREDETKFATLLEAFSAAVAADQRLLELARLREATEAENRALLSRLGRDSLVEHVVGERGGLRDVMERVSQVARTDVPVLILGETGSGKEVIARVIHERSPRNSGPMVRVNCGAIPGELIDSELFGHERGSFTGAVAQRKGWFERADGGTLLLDEVGELPLAAQVRLLRILQEGALERVGGHKTIHVDVRIVAATHRDLHQMVSEGTFREDLWYRIGVFPLRLPALRERKEDIPRLAAHFAERVGERLGGHALTLSASDIDQLLQYPWPGNVRELAAVVERAAILGHAKKLEIERALGVGQGPSRSVPPPERLPAKDSVAPAAASNAPLVTLDEAITAHIKRALAQTHGRVEGSFGAAKLLDINPHTLRSRMRKMKVDWTSFRIP